MATGPRGKAGPAVAPPGPVRVRARPAAAPAPIAPESRRPAPVAGPEPARPSSTYIRDSADLTAGIRTVARSIAPLLGVDAVALPISVDLAGPGPHGAAAAGGLRFTGTFDPARSPGRSLIIHELAHLRQHHNRAAGRGPAPDVTAAEAEAAGLAAADRAGRPLWTPQQALPEGHTAHDTGVSGVAIAAGPAAVERDLEALAAQNHLDEVQVLADQLGPEHAGHAEAAGQNSLRALVPLSFFVSRALIRAMRPEIRRRLAGFDDTHHQRYPDACIAVLAALDVDDLRALPARPGHTGSPAAAAVHGADPDRLSTPARRALLALLGRLPAEARAELERGDRGTLFTRLFRTPAGPDTDAADLAEALHLERELADRRRGSRPAGAKEGEPETAAKPGPPGAARAAKGAKAAAESGEETAERGADADEPAAGAPRRRAPRQVELIMPPAPTEPGLAQRDRIAKTTKAAGRAGERAKDLPTAPDTVGAARKAVPTPPVQTTAAAGQKIAAALGHEIPPIPALEKLADDIVDAIRHRRPPHVEDLTASKAADAAKEAGGTLSSAVGGAATNVQTSTERSFPAEPASKPAPAPQDLHKPGETVADPGIKAAAGVPDPIPAENLSLDADRDAIERKADAARMDRHSAEPLQGTPPFADVAQGRADLDQLAADGPAKVAKQQAEAIAAAEADMAGLQDQALQALTAARGGTVTTVHGGQQGMVKHEHKTRESVSAEALGYYTAARKQVEPMLQNLPGKAMALWDAGLAKVSTEFTEHLARIQGWIDDRHSGVGGLFLGKWDDWTGLPDWVPEEYDAAEEAFGTGVRTLLREIAKEVNTVLAAAEAIIADASTRIDGVFAHLQPDLREWADGERLRFQGQLGALSGKVAETRTNFVRDLSQRAVAAVTEVQEKVEELRTKARGILGRIADAIAAFLDDPVRTIINGLLNLLNIPPKAFWALVDKIASVVDQIADDPETFVNNLMEGLSQGFDLFFDHFGTHLLAGFWEWLTSGLGSAGVRLPTDFSPGSIFAFVLELMGLTWPNIREILVRHIGAKNVELIEKAWQLISTLIEKGPEGLVELLKEKLDPKTILDTIVNAAIEYATTRLIKAVTVKVLLMFNPASAVLQALKLIWTVLKWVFENAAKIFTFVQTVVDGIADVLAGNVGKLALAVEKALAKLIAPVIDFLASLVDLDDLPLEIAGVIKDLQKVVLAVADEVIGTLAEKAKDLLASLGLGGKKEGEEGAGDEELGTTVRFTAAGEQHKVYVDQEGADAHVMVASVPEQIAVKIEQWRADITAGKPADGEKRTHAAGLLDKLGPIAANAENEAEDLAKQFLAAKNAQDGEKHKPPSDDALENRERAIAALLDELFELFGEKADAAAYLKKIVAYLPKAGQARADTTHARWQERIGTFKIGAAEDAPRLWSAGVLAGTTAKAIEYTGRESTGQKLVPYFTTAAGKRDVDTYEFDDYAFANLTAPHTVRPDFNKLLGAAAVTALKRDGLANLDAAVTAKVVDRMYRDRMAKKIGDITADPDAAGGGSLVLPIEHVPDHTKFRPEHLKIVENGQQRTTTYDTVVGQRFTIATDRTAGLEVRAGGVGLRLMSGRGVTEDSPWFTSGQGFNRAHLIANEFGGSGFASGENLATTSARYNQETMRDAERQIGASIRKFAKDAKRLAEDVVFNLDVRVSFGELRDRELLAEIKQDPEFPAALVGTDLDALIEAKIKQYELHPELRRVIGVEYSWTAWIPAAPGATAVPDRITGSTEIGPDLWLLLDG